jgi:hypothetical protein
MCVSLTELQEAVLHRSDELFTEAVVTLLLQSSRIATVRWHFSDISLRNPSLWTRTAVAEEVGEVARR